MLEEDVTHFHFFLYQGLFVCTMSTMTATLRGGYIRVTLHYEVDNPEDEKCLLGNTDKSKLSNGMMITHICLKLNQVDFD